MHAQLRKSLLFVLVLALTLPVLAKDKAKNTDSKDAQILRKVQKVIADHPSFKNVQASVDDRIVTLNGTVDSYHTKVAAHDKLRSIDGVEGVRNLLNVNAASISDDQLRQKLAEKLRYDRIDRGIMFNNLTLAVSNGRVQLGGNVRTDADRASAVNIVENTAGVKDLVDNIEVAPASFNDDDLRIRVARAIYGHPALQKYAIDPEAPIRIVVENGHVTLDGVVDSAMDKQIAEIQAKSVPGAFSVDDKLMVANSQQHTASNTSH